MMHLYRQIQLTCIILALILGMSTSVVQGGQADYLPRQVRNTLYYAQQAIKAENYDQARSTINGYLTEKPDAPYAEVYLLLGNTWFYQENYTAAQEAYQHGLAVIPASVDLHRNYALVCYQTGQFRLSGEHFVEAYNIQKKAGQPPDADFLYQAATAYYQGEHFPLAEITLQQLTANFAPPRQDWLILLAYTQISLKSWAAAEKTIETLLITAPQSAEYWELLAHLNINRNRYRDAAAALEIAYQLKLPEPGDWKNLSDIYYYINAPLKAAGCLEKALGQKKCGDITEQLAETYARALRYDKAIEFIQKTIDLAPSPEHYLKKGIFLYHKMDTARAMEAFQEALELDDKNSTACIMLGLCAMDLKEWKEAEQALKRAAGFERYRSWAEGSLAIVEELIEAEKNQP